MPWAFESDHFYAIFIQMYLFLGLLHFFPVLERNEQQRPNRQREWIPFRRRLRPRSDNFACGEAIVNTDRTPRKNNKTDDKEAALDPIPASHPSQHHRSGCQAWQR